jgi:hypothetical protein
MSCNTCYKGTQIIRRDPSKTPEDIRRVYAQCVQCDRNPLSKREWKIMARQAGSYLTNELPVRRSRMRASAFGKAPFQRPQSKPSKAPRVPFRSLLFPSVPTHVPTHVPPHTLHFPAVPTHKIGRSNTRDASGECRKCIQLYARYKDRINNYRNWLKYLYDTIDKTTVKGVYQMNRNHHNYKQFQSVMIQYRTLLKEIRNQIENHTTPRNAHDHSGLLRLINRRIQLLTNCTDDHSALRPHCKANQIDMFRYVNGRPMSVI